MIMLSKKVLYSSVPWKLRSTPPQARSLFATPTTIAKEKVLTERLELPPDVANGTLFTLLKNVQQSVPKATVSYVAATPKPRLVNLEIIPQGQEPSSIGSYTHKAMRYVVKVKIGGVAGAIARLMGMAHAAGIILAYGAYAIGAGVRHCALHYHRPADALGFSSQSSRSSPPSSLPVS